MNGRQDPRPEHNQTAPHGLQARLQETEAALRAATVALAARDAFITALGRELSNPLTPVMVAIDRLRRVSERGEPHRIEAALAMLERAGAAFGSRARSLLNFVEMTRTPPQLACEPVDIAASLTRAAGRHAEMARRAGCILELSAAPRIVVRAGPAALDEILDQLLANALKFGAGRPVLLRAARDDHGHARLSICDRGPGVGAGDIDAIFGLLQHARPKGAPGLGIGLWVSRQMAQAMGATITAASRPPWSACFELAFPNAQEGPSPLSDPPAKPLS